MQKTKLALAALTFGVAAGAWAQEARKELRRTDLSGAPGMEVVLSVTEYQPGDAMSLHFHHGVEAGYVLEGGKIQAPGLAVADLPAGASVMNLRDVPHGGWRNAGTTTIKLLTVHVVDKGKPLYDEPKK